MARNNRGGSNRGSRNNNPSGRNQYSSDWGVMEMARERPIAAAAVAAGAAAAGLFLWTKRSQISDQLSSLSDQFSEWTQGMGSSSERVGHAGPDQVATDGVRDTSVVDAEVDAPPEQRA